MRRQLVMAAFLASAGLAGGGCSVDTCAHLLVDRPHWPFVKAVVWLTGGGEKLVREGRIDSHHTVTALDGTRLDVWVIEARPAAASKASAPGAPRKPRGTVVLIHGLAIPKAYYLSLGHGFARAGFDVVMPDLRAHGHSGGDFMTYGVKEKHDIKSVVDDLTARGVVGEPIYAFGISMGAAVAVQYAAVDPRCKGVMAVAPYQDLRTIARRYGWFLGRKTFDAILARAGELGGFDPQRASTVQAAAKLTVPLIVAHGGIDLVIPFRHGEAVYNAASEPRKLLPVRLAGHGTILIGRSRWFVREVEWLGEPRRGSSAAETQSTQR